jgi:SpoVK/Ycf46/Vps4 family AAA+-type ATPase
MSINNNQSMLHYVERISSSAAKSGFEFDNLLEIKEDIEGLSKFLDITHNQTILLACLIELSLQRTVTIDILAKHLKCNVLKVITNIQEIEALERKTYIQRIFKTHGRKVTYSDFGYIVPFNIVEALRTSEKDKLKQIINFNLPNFLEKAYELIHSREDSSMTTLDLYDQIEFLIANNIGLPFLQFIDKNAKLTINKCIVIALAYYRFKKEFNYSIDSLTQAIFDDLSDQMQYEQNLTVGRNELFKNDMIYFQESQFMNEKIISLTKKSLKVLYKDFPELNIKNETEDLLFKANAIKSKSLFFTDSLEKQIDNIAKVLNKRSFPLYQKKLEAKNLPKGISIMFYGKSGTGKTESVFQIARKISRDILMVDLSQLRSKWFGDSEKIVKKVFDDYRRLCNNSFVKPILFINEADGMFSKRMEMNGKSSSVDQTLNTIQNIILQEMETFEGILFATTNLTVNLDSAFERRFLFKVEFSNPLAEVGQQIWLSKLPELTETQANLLASKYSFSGGEIENITRKYIIDPIVGDDSLDINRLIEFCEQEKPFQMDKRIGFVHR